MEKALQNLDEKLVIGNQKGVKLLIGGGAAFSIAYQVPIQTADIDGGAFKSAITPAELDQCVKATAKDLKISPDWLNPYFETFLGCLPPDYGDRLALVYQGKVLEVFALGVIDLLIMKCFAGREKDVPHAKILIRKGADVDFVEKHLRSLEEKGIKGAKKALDFLIEVEEQVGQ